MFVIQDRDTAKKLLEVFFEHSTNANASEVIEAMGEDAYIFMAWESLDILEERAVMKGLKEQKDRQLAEQAFLGRADMDATQHFEQAGQSNHRVTLEADLNFQEVHAACKALQIALPFEPQ